MMIPEGGLRCVAAWNEERHLGRCTMTPCVPFPADARQLGSRGLCVQRVPQQIRNVHLDQSAFGL